ncbi:MAG: T9SS type A sorting domain-containing protein [Bacteroidales bacterium]|nr:T9SS type A sorting domain-containing protein [Bacteroidales bacterium]
MLLKTVDGGATWDTLFYPSFVQLNSICFPTSDTGYIVGESPAPDLFILKTTDGGNNWVEINCNVCNWNGIIFTKVFFFDSEVGFAAGGYQSLQKTTNGGISWGINGNFVFARDFDFPSDSIGYANYGLKTINAGDSWFDISSNFPNFNSILAVGYHTENIGYIAGNKWTGSYNLGKIACTYNGGQTWNDFLLSSTSDIMDIYIHDEDNAYFIGGKIIKTIDQGNTFYYQTIEDVLFGALHSIYFASPKIGYAVGIEGEILKTTNDGGEMTPVSFLTVETNEDNENRIDVFPVPALNQLNVRVPEGIITQVEIYSTTGQLLQKTISNKTQKSIDISGLPPGNYFIRAISREQVFVRKFVVVR